MSKKSHVVGWEEDFVNPAQLAEFYSRLYDGWVTKQNLQSLLRREHVVLPVINPSSKVKGNCQSSSPTYEQLKEFHAQICMKKVDSRLCADDLNFYLKGVYPVWDVLLSGRSDWMSDFFNNRNSDERIMVEQEIGSSNFPIQVESGVKAFGIIKFEDDILHKRLLEFIKERGLRLATPYEFISFLKEYGSLFEWGSVFENYALLSLGGEYQLCSQRNNDINIWTSRSNNWTSGFAFLVVID